MGTKVQIDSCISGHFSMRESNGASWPCYYADNNNIPNGQYYGFIPTTTSDYSHSDYDKHVVKQTMVEHEVIFKNQVFELHRLYQVQRDLMEEVRRKKEIKHGIPYETSSSSSHVPSRMQHDDMQLSWNRNSPTFPLANSFANRTVQSSPLSIKGKSIQFQNCCSPKNSESRPTKCRRKMLDLQLPAYEYIDDPDEVEQFGEAKVSDKNRLNPFLNGCRGGDVHRSQALADFNEPLEETTVDSSVDFYRDCSNKLFGSSKDVPQRSVHRRSLNGVLSNTPFENGSNGRDWFCYPLESEHKGNVRPIKKGTPSTSCQPMTSLVDQHTQPPPSNKGDLSSHVPNRSTWDRCSSSLNKPSGFFSSHNKSRVSTSPFLEMDSKSPQSSAQSNYVFGNKWNLNSTLGANASSHGGESGFHQGSGFKDIPGRVGPVNLDDVKPVKGVNLNVPYSSNGISYYQTVQPDLKSKDPISVLPPWLRGNGSCSKEGEKSKNGTFSCDGDVKSEKPKSSDCPSSRKIQKGGFDMNLPCEELSDSEVDAVNMEVVVIEKRRENECANNFRNNFDLNLCVTEEESPLCRTASSVRGDTGIDLEAPASVESDEDVQVHLTEEKQTELVTGHADNGESELARSAAEMIVAISSEMLRWFVDIACTSGTDPESHMIQDPTDNNQGLDEYESMILRSKECTVEEYFPKPSIPEFPNMKGNNRTCLLTTRSRKGRGRQRRDFQKDILPGLTSLSRHQVTQDLQMFGGLMRATSDHTWHSPPNRRNANTNRNGCGRGRRRSVVTPTAPADPGISPSKQVSSSNTDMCLTGWGKTTRRPRRQRCPSANPPPTLAMS